MTFCPDFQSGQVEASCRTSELTYFIRNRVVFDGHRL